MPAAARVVIAPPAPEELDAIRELFAEYAASLGFSLAYQGFEVELAGLPGEYAAPAGALLLARCEGVAAGTVALRRLAPDVCEMKRLYVRPAWRGVRTAEGHTIGRALALGVVDAARALGYRRLRLDTIAGRMAAAIRLYESMGFAQIPAYYASPVPDTVFMELVLA